MKQIHKLLLIWELESHLIIIHLINRINNCGTGEAISNRYVKEYKIPTACTQPLAITTDPHGTIWFAQTNSGNLAKFDPLTEKFTEFDNAVWDDYFQALSESVGEKIPARSMMWGIDYFL